MIQNLRKKVSKNKAKKLRRYNLKSLKKPRMYGGSGEQQVQDPIKTPNKKFYQYGVTKDQSLTIAKLIQTIHAQNLTGRVPFGSKVLDLKHENWKDVVKRKHEGNEFIAAMETIIALNDKQQGQQGQQDQQGQQVQQGQQTQLGQQGQSGQDQVALGQQDQQVSCPLTKPKYVYMTFGKLNTLLNNNNKEQFVKALSENNDKYVNKKLIEQLIDKIITN
jgi:hypothetical protein